MDISDQEIIYELYHASEKELLQQEEGTGEYTEFWIKQYFFCIA